jgi:hypothetical protein
LAQLEVADATLLFRYQGRPQVRGRVRIGPQNDDAAIAKAKVLAIGVSLDKPEVDPTRHIAVLNASREQIFSVPVYSKPSMSTT